MTGFMDEPDGGDRERGRTDRDVEREGPPRNRRHTDRRPDDPDKRAPQPMTDDERIDEGSEDSFPASDPPRQP